MGIDATSAEIIKKLSLLPHPEGGYYVETFRSPDRVTLADGRVRSAGTAIYYLLPKGKVSALHRVAADEVWHHYMGAPLELLTISPGGVLEKIVLGKDLPAGQRAQQTVPSGVWQAARSLPSGEGFTLAGCTVSPGFDFADFEMPGHGVLLDIIPEHAEIIEKFMGEVEAPDEIQASD
jgi:predicted cupin superfamily sugar epimerase